MSDQEAWHELCNLYLIEGDYNKAVFCMEEVLLHNPYSHLIHQRLGDIRYTMGGQDNIEIAKSYYAQAVKLNGSNLRALYGLYLVSFHQGFHICILIFFFFGQCCNFIAVSKAQIAKRKEAQKLSSWALQKVSELTKRSSKSSAKGKSTDVEALEAAFGNLDVKSN